MEKQTKKRKPYTSDLTDAQWSVVTPLIPVWNVVRPPRTNMREVVNAIFYLLTNGCGWRNLPHDFPPEGTVRDYFHRWKRLGIWDNIHDTLREKVRVAAGREPTPSAGSIDSQGVKAARTSKVRGFDMGKKINGIKRHILIDTLGLLLVIVVHTADIQDRDGAKLVFAKVKNRFPRLKLLWADGGYAGKLIEYVHDWYFGILQIVKRNDDMKGFTILPRRWVVERTFGWLMNYRRLCRHDEYWPETGETMVKIAMIHIMLRQLA